MVRADQGADVNAPLLDGLAAPLGILDGAGRLVAFNAAWCGRPRPMHFLGEDSRIGTDYADFCESCPGEGGYSAAVGIRAILANELSSHSQTYPSLSANQPRWLQMQAVRLTGQSPLAVAVVHEYVGGSKLAFLSMPDGRSPKTAKPQADAQRIGNLHQQIGHMLEQISGALRAHLDLTYNHTVAALRQVVDECGALTIPQYAVLQQLIAEFERVVPLSNSLLDLLQVLGEQSLLEESPLAGPHFADPANQISQNSTTGRRDVTAPAPPPEQRKEKRGG